MTKKIKRAVIYSRVSSKQQVLGESLETQRQECEKYIKSKGWKLIKVYEDAGISGASLEGRDELKSLLNEVGKFDFVVVFRLSRFGRNTTDLLNNVRYLKENGITFVSVRESISFKGAYGQAFLEILSAICQLEKEMIFDRMYEARIAKAERRGIPPFRKAQWPVAREYIENKWVLNKGKANLYRWAAREYLKTDISLNNLCKKLSEKGMKSSPQNLRLTFLTRCNDKYIINFKVPDPEDEDKKIPYPVEIPVPSILSDETISELRKKLTSKFKSWNSDSASKYPLKGYIFCEHCNRTLTGQTQRAKGRKKYHSYYRHPKNPICEAYTYIRCQLIEDSFFKTIFNVLYDKPSFDKAIKGSLPDKKYVQSLKNKRIKLRKELNSVERDIKKLVDSVIKGVLRQETVKEKENELYQRKFQLRNDIVETIMTLRSLPDIKTVQKEADKIRKNLIEKFKSQEHLMSMDYEAKRRLVHWIFRETGETPRKSNLKIKFPKKGIFVRIVDKDFTSYNINGTVLTGSVQWEPGNDSSSYIVLDSDKDVKEVMNNAYNDYKSEHIPEYDGSYPSGAYSHQKGRYRTNSNLPG